MTTAAETLMQGLRNAHAMEKQAIESTENQIDRLKNYPEMQAWVRDHVEASKRQRERVRQCLERRGGDASSLKDMALSIMGNIQEMTGAMASDEVIKNAITDYGFKHYEVAAYISLSAAADAVGDPETKRVAEEIAREEEQLAGRLKPILPVVMSEYLRREETGQAAKR
jgi:ferritin-like metal-binding protein YciE